MKRVTSGVASFLMYPLGALIVFGGIALAASAMGWLFHKWGFTAGLVGSFVIMGCIFWLVDLTDPESGGSR